ncbi:MAG: hypothetical protein GY945_16130 [Rhodobacteraceae bacterium]|nr:hypothetical protein [Paracoccaceae bacterium]
MSEIKLVEKYDPRGLIRESYRIDGIDAGQCRSVFLDWVLGAGARPALSEQIAVLLAHYSKDAPDHPMSDVLRAGLEGEAASKGRQGGWRSRAR